MARIQEHYIDTEARQVAFLLMEHVLNLTREQILVDTQLEISVKSMDRLEEGITKLEQLHPIQHVIGKAHFYGRSFYVDSNVLIPRQETEELVDAILVDNKRPNLKVLDIGTGSGCIALTLALELKNASVTALDVDAKALNVTQRNASMLGVDLKTIQADILSMDALPDSFDIIVSNPPYVTESEKEVMSRLVLDNEPHLALFVTDDDPLLFYEKIGALSKRHLSSQGKLYLEINEQFGANILKLLEGFQFDYLQLVKDLNGNDRFIKAMLA